jgi:hypothetical protein
MIGICRYRVVAQKANRTYRVSGDVPRKTRDHIGDLLGFVGRALIDIVGAHNVVFAKV